MAQTITVILLEDDRPLRELMAEGLRDAAFTVVETVTGAEALDALRSVAPPHVLVADRALAPGNSGPNGFQVAETARDLYPGLGVIYISGTHLALKHRSLGARERALYKPFALHQLVGLLQELTD
jgi:two-component system cell cycle response regulator CpdR